MRIGTCYLFVSRSFETLWFPRRFLAPFFPRDLLSARRAHSRPFARQTCEWLACTLRARPRALLMITPSADTIDLNRFAKWESLALRPPPAFRPANRSFPFLIFRANRRAVRMGRPFEACSLAIWAAVKPLSNTASFSQSKSACAYATCLPRRYVSPLITPIPFRFPFFAFSSLMVFTARCFGEKKGGNCHFERIKIKVRSKYRVRAD